MFGELAFNGELKCQFLNEQVQKVHVESKSDRYYVLHVGVGRRPPPPI